jgi:hypothetical protein
MNDVNQIAEEIVTREGGYVNDPDDPGGATNFGVTIHTMRRLGLDLDRDGVVTEQDVRVLSREQAVAIFINHYFERPRIRDLPAALHASVFDMYVNAGAQQGMAAAVDHFVDAYGIARRNYYYALADARPASRKYARRLDGGKGGWITRAEEFISPRYHLSHDEHRERIAQWV